MEKLPKLKKTAKEILHALFWHTGGMQQNSVAAPGWTPAGWWEMDYFRMTKHVQPSIWEYEIKTSWADFQNDFKLKTQTFKHEDDADLPFYAQRNVELGKHQIMGDPAMADRCFPHYFSFAICPSIRGRVEEFLKEFYPAYGLYSWTPTPWGDKTQMRFDEIRKPQRIKPKNDDKAAWAAKVAAIQLKAKTSMSHRYWDLKLTAIGCGKPFPWEMTQAQHEFEESGSAYDL